MAAVWGVVGLILVLFEIVLVARMVVDWVAVASPSSGWVGQARYITHAVTEPVLAPVRRVLRPVRIGSMSVDLAFTVVFIAVIILRGVVGAL